LRRYCDADAWLTYLLTYLTEYKRNSRDWQRWWRVQEPQWSRWRPELSCRCSSSCNTHHITLYHAVKYTMFLSFYFSRIVRYSGTLLGLSMIKLMSTVNLTKTGD